MNVNATSLYPFIDQGGFPFNQKKDGLRDYGDSTQRLGMIRVAEKALGTEILSINFNAQLNNVQFQNDKEYVRHPSYSYWAERGIMSRDNMLSLICAMLLWGLHTRVRENAFTLLKRGGFFWNVNDLEGKRKKIPIPDWISPLYVATLARAFQSPLSRYVVQPFLDLAIPLTALWRVIFAKLNPKHTSDDLNFQCVLVCALLVKPNFLVKLAVKIYRHRDPNPQDAIRTYFRPRKDMTPIPIPDIWEVVILRYIYGRQI